MSDWRDRVDRLLYDGERVVESVGVGSDSLVVTTHRLLAFTPDREGANFRATDLPNVGDVRLSTDGNSRYLRWTLRPLLLGGILVLAGTRLSIGDPLSGVDTSGAEQTGAGGILSTVSSLTGLLAVLDDVMVLLGALCLLVVALLLGLYLYSRETRLVVEIAGDDDLALTVASDRDAAVTRLEAALASAGRPDESVVDGPGATGGDAPAPDTTGVEDSAPAEPGDSEAVEPTTVEDVLSAASTDRDDTDDPPEALDEGLPDAPLDDADGSDLPEPGDEGK